MAQKKSKVASPSKAVDQKLKAIESAVEAIEKSCGKGAVMRLTDRPNQRIDVIPSGSLALDIALGVGGVPRGRIIELYGPESSGKTTLALHAIANAQKAGGYAVLIDAEHAYDPTYGKKLGIDSERLFISQPDYGEQALNNADILISSGGVDIVVIDSVAALVPRAELEGDMGDTQVGLQARMMSKAMRKLTATANRSGTCVIFINQIREKVGVMFGSPETTPGGRALKFFSSVRMEIRRTKQIKEGDEAVGITAQVTVKKNKVAPPFRKCLIDIYFNRGVSYLNDLLTLGTELGILSKSGNWYIFGEEKLGNGKAKTMEFLRSQEGREIFHQLDSAVKETVFQSAEEEQKTAPEKDLAEASA